jgi:NAD+ kinase
MNLGIFGKNLKEEGIQEIENFFKYIEQAGHTCIVFKKFLDECLRMGLVMPSKTFQFSNYESFSAYDVDVMISIGGDGTILETLEYIREKGTPVIGINRGRLGFLAGVQAEDAVAMLKEIEKGHYAIDSRTVLQLESDRNMFGGVNYALNDFVIHKKDSSSMITIHAFVNGEYLNSYWSDGLIISTPTGSTGYNLSCGGPILYPTSESFVITPIAPHNLNVRPIIISDENIISFEVEGRSPSFLATLDARSESIDNKTQLAIRKANFEFKLIRLNNEDYLRTLREKLMWGIDNRNFKN